jgi:hypothetical protein
VNNEFKNAPEGTTHKLDGRWYDINSDLESDTEKLICVKNFTVGGYWSDLCLLSTESYLQLQPREQNLWYDFEEQEAFAFPTKADKFLYNGAEACIIGVSADGVYFVMDCADGLRKLTVDDLEFITPIETPEVEQRLEHTLRGQSRGMRKFLKDYDKDVKIDKAKLVELYDEGWRISKTNY